MDILKAKVAVVKIGLLEIEGLLFEDGTFGVAMQQAAMLFSVPQNNAQRDFKALLGGDFQFLKVCTDRAVRQNRSENAIKILDFERLVAKLDRKGNKLAQGFRDTLVGLSLHQLFCDAFDITFEIDDRQEFLRERMESKALFWELTETIRDTRLAANKEINRYHYSNPMNAINRGLFGKTAKEIRTELQIPDGALTRDSFGTRSLRRITVVQETSALKVRRGDEPCQAIVSVIRELSYPVIDFRS